MAAIFLTAFITVIGGSLTLLFTTIGLYGLVFENKTSGDRAAALWAIILALFFAVVTRWLIA